MNVNTLVTHKKFKIFGIGCVSKVLKNGIRVNFGTDDVMLCIPNKLQEVDTSKCKTVEYKEYRDRILKDGSSLNFVILGNTLQQYVGIGWVVLRAITHDDLTKYPRVI